MKSEKDIEEKFNEMWKELNVTHSPYFEGLINGYISALDWVMDGKLFVNKRNKVIK